MVYDLSHTVNEDTPVYPGDPKVTIKPESTFEAAGCCDHKLSLGSHTGTHIDAPAHMIPGGKELKDYPIDRFVLQATCIDARQGFDAKLLAQIKPGEAVLFYTGASEYFHQPRYFQDYPVLDDASIKALIDKQVSLVGLDTGSADIAEGFPVHKALLGADILILENLANLQELVGKTFKLYALPLKLEKDGAPVRAIAEITN